VSDVELGEQDLRFTVDQVGVPVLVKMSYFPNWEVSGAEGPYRIAPNLMVVVPTETDVHLTYERSRLDILAYVLTFAGLVLLVVWRRLGDVRHRSDEPFAAAGGPADDGDDPRDAGDTPSTLDASPNGDVLLAPATAGAPDARRDVWDDEPRSDEGRRAVPWTQDWAPAEGASMTWAPDDDTPPAGHDHSVDPRQ
jgi:hypothetical protein